MNIRKEIAATENTPPSVLSARHDRARVLAEEHFRHMFSTERKRVERSGKTFLLALLGTGKSISAGKTRGIFDKVLAALLPSVRETDVVGWYERDQVLGILFTELNGADKGAIFHSIVGRLTNTVRGCIGIDALNQVSISFHWFPEDWEHEIEHRPSNAILYPDLERREQSRKLFSVLKRAIDILGSVLALVVLAPLFVAIAIAIKLSSPGPVLFKQYRVGQYGIPFVLLKFRSMRVDNSAETHREYVHKLIKGEAEAHTCSNTGAQVYKITNDSRITTLGSLLRRTSLDELPQFLNVLIGNMSLVGPRPPIPYELDAYEIWHRRRLLEAKPGITGLWQVSGRSRVTFDEMVRLDLQYASTWSPWLDVKILFRTPWAVIQGDGAY